MKDQKDVTHSVETGTQDILAAISGSVATITLNRPDRRNALSMPMLEGLAKLLADFEIDDGVAVVVLTGAGSGFCAGGDVKSFKEQGGVAGHSDTLDRRLIDRQRASQRATVGKLYTYAKPVVAALPGAAAGAGLGLALSADLRIGCSRTVMAPAFAGVALSGDFGTTWLLSRLVGPAKARELLWLNAKLRAEECLRLGLLNWLVADDELQAKTNEIAHTLANGPRGCLGKMKRNLLMAGTADLFSAMDLEVELHLSCGVTADHRE
ncbi:MAG TPA: enoyl-CoA hydratase-related protein, partial [Nevskiaceae bacterium]|nr:enoyl-CoA hydratase-related protein [Nevskiaceae bacterium]